MIKISFCHVIQKIKKINNGFTAWNSLSAARNINL